MLSATQQSAPAVQLEFDRKLVELREFHGRLLWMALISLVFVVIGAVMLSHPRPGQPDAAIGFLIVVFFGLGGLTLLIRLEASRRATAILTSAGITCPSAFDGVLPWGAVQSCEYVAHGKNRVLNVTPYADVVEDISWRGLASWQVFLQGKTAARFAIPLNSHPEDEARFLEVFMAREIFSRS